jgi:hypothetical protein
MNRVRRTGIALAALAVSSAAAAAPIGTLESEARFLVRAGGDAEFVRMDQASYTFFSGDTIRADRGAAVLNFETGGGLGFHEGTQATVTMNDDGTVTGDVAVGKVLYALPEAAAGMQLTAGEFTITTIAPEARRVDVAGSGERVGTVEALADGHVRVDARSGDVHVLRAGAERVQVAAGESVGLLNVPEAAAVDVQAASDITITAPERVGTGRQFEVTWQSAQPIEGDYLVIAPEGAPADQFEAVVSTTEGSELTFTAPSSAGDYEVRVIDRDSGEVKGFVPLAVVPDEAAAVVAGGAAAGGGGGLGAAGTAVAVAAGAVAVYIGTEVADDDDGQQEPVSP